MIILNLIDEFCIVFHTGAFLMRFDWPLLHLPFYRVSAFFTSYNIVVVYIRSLIKIVLQKSFLFEHFSENHARFQL